MPAPEEAVADHGEKAHVGFAESVEMRQTASGQGGSSVAMGKMSSKKSIFSPLKRAETLRQVAIFANNIAMDDDDELKSEQGDGEMSRMSVNSSDGAEAEESGTERLQKALTMETKHKGLFRYTNTLGSAVGIEPDVLMRVALEDEWQMVSCASLPFTIVFFVIFMLFFQLHYGVTDIFLAEASLRSKLATPATELTQAKDLYDWLENSYFPFLWGAKKDDQFGVKLNSESLYQDLVAGVRLSTTRAVKGKCEDELVNYMDCYSAFSDSQMDGAGVFGRRLQGAEDRMTEAERKAIWQKHQEAQAAEDARRELEDLPAWAKPGLSKGFQAWQRSKTEGLSSSQRERRRTDEGRDWRRTSSCTALDSCGVAPGSSTILAKPRERRRPPPPPGWQRGRALAEGAARGRLARRLERRAKVQAARVERQKREERRLRVNRPELRPLTPRLTDGNRSEVIIPMSWTLQEVKAELQRWKKDKLIQETTLTFGAEALVLNNNLGHDMLTSLAFEFSIHRGGDVFTEVKIITVVLSEVARDGLQSMMGIGWVLCLVSFSLMLPSRAYLRWKQGRLRSHFCRFWNMLEWGIITWGWMVFAIFVLERSEIWKIKSEILDYKKERNKIPPWQHAEMDKRELAVLLDKNKTLTDVSMWCQMIVSLYHIILVCRFFLASRGQPRLAVVLSTIRKASVDLAHLLVVFMIIFIAYAISGHILFGRRLQEFSTFQGAFARCFQIVMEREYTWIRFTEEDLWTATIWVWSFLLLVVLVLVNIFLAMIFDTYGDVRSSVGHSATLWQTTKIVMTHLKHTFSFGNETDKWVPNRELVQAVKGMQCQYVTPWMVKDAFPGISNRQVNYIFNLGKNRLENMLLRGNKSSLPAVIASILLGIERMHQGLQMMESNTKRKVDKSESGSSASLAAESDPAASKGGGIGVHDSSEAPHFSPPVDPPPWVKVQLLPHFQKQKNLLTQVHVQIQRIERAMHLRGLGANVPPPPGATPRDIKVRGALGTPGSTMLPCGPSGATSASGMLPSALRSGLTASGGEEKNPMGLASFGEPPAPAPDVEHDVVDEAPHEEDEI